MVELSGAFRMRTPDGQVWRRTEDGVSWEKDLGRSSPKVRRNGDRGKRNYSEFKALRSVIGEDRAKHTKTQKELQEVFEWLRQVENWNKHRETYLVLVRWLSRTESRLQGELHKDLHNFWKDLDTKK